MDRRFVYLDTKFSWDSRSPDTARDINFCLNQGLSECV